MTNSNTIAPPTNADGLTFRGVLKDVSLAKKDDKFLPFGRATFETEKGLTKINIAEVMKHPMGDIELQAFRVLSTARPGGTWELTVFVEPTIYNGKPYFNITAVDAFPLD